MSTMKVTAGQASLQVELICMVSKGSSSILKKKKSGKQCRTPGEGMESVRP